MNDNFDDTVQNIEKTKYKEKVKLGKNILIGNNVKIGQTAQLDTIQLLRKMLKLEIIVALDLM